MSRNNIYQKMSHIFDVNDVFQYTNNNIGPHNVYINLDSTLKLFSIAPILYKNVPKLRSKMIQTTKSYQFSRSIYDIIDTLNSGSQSAKNIEKICVVSDDKDTIDYIKSKKMDIIIISNKQFDIFINNNNSESILLIDAGYNKLNLTNKNNIHVMIPQLIN